MNMENARVQSLYDKMKLDFDLIKSQDRWTKDFLDGYKAAISDLFLLAKLEGIELIK